MIPRIACLLSLALLLAGCANRNGSPPGVAGHAEPAPAPTPAGAAQPAPAPKPAAATPAEPEPVPEHAKLETVPIDLVVLGDSLDALRDDFNAHVDQMRLVALLSPKCALCIEGIKGIFEEVLLAHPHAEIRVEAVWMQAQGGETHDTALSSAHFAPTPRVRHYWDENNLAGHAVGRHLTGREELAWDIYLFYEPGKTWGDTPPEPLDYTTQRTNINAAHLPVDLDIRRDLRRKMELLADYIPE